MTVQLVLATTGLALATVVAAIDDGQLPPADRRILVTSNNAAAPEGSPDLHDVAGVSRLLDRFDAIHSYNAVVAPQHPSVWRPRADDLSIWRRYLQQSWDVDDRHDEITLLLESIWVPPALVLALAFPDARIVAYGEGLMSYGPTRDPLPMTVAARVERLLHLDLLPGVRPLLLTELAVPSVVVSGESFTKVVDTLESGPPLPETGPREIAVLLGQYLAAASILTAAEEHELHLKMITGAIAAGFRTLVFKPHPSSPDPSARPLQLRARRLGAELEVSSTPALVESWFSSDRIGLVVGSFSTGLATASALYGLPVARVGTPKLLRRLRPYENSNRIPLTAIDASVPDLADCAQDADAAPAPLRGTRLEELLRAVAYTMQPGPLAGLRAATVDTLTQQPAWRRRYVARRRLSALDLPGKPPVRSPGRQRLFRLLGPRRYRSLSRVWRRVRTLAR